jgi:3-isopropylmalate dehydrogenase
MDESVSQAHDGGVSPPAPTLQIAVLPGDGIGADVTREALRVLRALEARVADLRFSFTEHAVGAAEYLRNGDPLPDSAVRACRDADAVLLGAMGLPEVRWPDGREMTPQIDLREKLDLYAGPRPIRLYHADDTPLKGLKTGEIDFVIVRENTEGLFAERLKASASETEATDLMKVTRRGCERLMRFAFALARKRRKHCTLVDKANVLPSMVFMRRVFDEIAEEYPDVTTDRVYVDAMALFLVRKPQAYDVIVTENMFGDILSDLAGGLVGGMGMAPSGDIGEACAVFQPSHGTAPDIAGKGIANPTAAILSAAMMLDWLGRPDAARMIESAVQRTFDDPRKRTPDMGGQLRTHEITEHIITAL